MNRWGSEIILCFYLEPTLVGRGRGGGDGRRGWEAGKEEVQGRRREGGQEGEGGERKEKNAIAREGRESKKVASSGGQARKG